MTLADFSAYPLGVRVADGSTPRAGYALADAAELHAQGRLSMPVQQVFPLREGAGAHRFSATGRGRGKVVLSVP